MEKGDRSYRQRISDALTNHIYVRPQEEMLAGYSGPVWRYEYQYGMPGSGMGCLHASELPVLFDMNDPLLIKTILPSYTDLANWIPSPFFAFQSIVSFLERLVILDQFFEGERLIPVDVNSGVQNSISAHDTAADLGRIPL